MRLVRVLCKRLVKFLSMLSPREKLLIRRLVYGFLSFIFRD